MIKLYAGPKGQGKTRKLIELANATLETTHGHIIFMDDDKRNMHQLQRDIRLVETSEFPLLTYREFISFVHGMLSQNGDIKEIFVDSLSTLVKDLDNENLVKVMAILVSISEIHHVNFIISVHCEVDQLPQEIQKFVV